MATDPSPASVPVQNKIRLPGLDPHYLECLGGATVRCFAREETSGKAVSPCSIAVVKSSLMATRRAYSPAQQSRISELPNILLIPAIPPGVRLPRWAWVSDNFVVFMVASAVLALVGAFCASQVIPSTYIVPGAALAFGTFAFGYGAFADMRRASAERSRASAEASRASAEASRASAEASRASSEKTVFYVRMMAISSSSSGDTPSDVDTTRRGAPTPVSVSEEAFFAGFPAVAMGAVQALWSNCTSLLFAEWKAPTGSTLDENRDVHPVVAAVLRALMPLGLRLWQNFIAEDDVPCAKIRPDFTVTHKRDAAVSVVGGLLAVEVKLLGELKKAVTQTCAYLRRRVYKICCEREARGESCDDVFALGVATDGLNVVFVRVASGAPAPGGSFLHAVPCPAWCTQPIALFRGWDFVSKPNFRAAAPPAGFAALARLLLAPESLFGGGAPLENLRAIITGTLPFETHAVTLAFGDRVGCGGSSDVYELVGGISSTASAAAGCVVKVARSTTAAICQSFEAERGALLSLRNASATGLVPELICVGSRDPDCAWPLLVLRPRGTQLQEWVQAYITRAAPTGATSADALSLRRKCASIVARRLFEVLETSHAMKIVHCDVRPLNVVVVGDSPMLVDWGSSRPVGTTASGSGVAAYSSQRIFEAGSCNARPAQDIAGVLYTWLCIAFDSGCVAPWLSREHADDTAMFDARSAWIRAHALRDSTVAEIEQALQVIESPSNRKGSASLVAHAQAALRLSEY